MVFGPPDRHDRPQDDKPEPSAKCTLFAFALGSHTLRRASLRLDRRRLGKMQTSLAFALGLHNFAGLHPA